MSSQFKFNWSQFKFLNLILNCIKKKNRGTSSIQLNFLIHQLTVQGQYSSMPMLSFYADHSHLHTLLESLTSISAAGSIGFPLKPSHILTQNTVYKINEELSLHLSVQDFTKKNFWFCLIEVTPLESLLTVVIIYVWNKNFFPLKAYKCIVSGRPLSIDWFIARCLLKEKYPWTN